MCLQPLSALGTLHTHLQEMNKWKIITYVAIPVCIGAS